MTESLNVLFTEQERLKERIAIIKTELDGINEDIEKTVEKQCKQARDLSGKDYGSIDIVVDGITVKHNVSKKVTWDGEKLAELWKKIEDAGDEPSAFIDKEIVYKIPEKKYDTIPNAMRTVFDKARTVDAGKSTIKLSIKE